MSQKKRYKVSLPSGDTLWLQGNTISEAFWDGWEKYSSLSDESGQTTKCLTVREFIIQKYKPAFFDTLKDTTRITYEQYLNLNILPFLGDYPMNQVKVDTIQKFYNWMATASQRGRKADLNKNTIERVRGLTSRIFKVAQEMGIISDTPFKNTILRIRAASGTHHNALDDDTVTRIKREIPLLEDEEEKLYMTLSVFMGMRPEEVMGLCWEDLNLEHSFGYVRRAVTYPDNSKPCIDTPKTEKSVRTILITSIPKRVLTSTLQVSGFILGGEQPWCYSHKERVRRRAFDHLDLKGVTPYDFRATFATQAKESGLTSAQVADLLGHADTRMVETVYARTRHNSVMKQLDAIERLNR